jgi:alpha-tubulin suppressor-like RCC1 family protein/phage-related protein
MSFLYDRDYNITGTVQSSFDFSPSYGTTVSFSTELSSHTTVDNYVYMMPKGVNHLQMRMQMRFENRKEEESRKILSFFEGMRGTGYFTYTDPAQIYKPLNLFCEKISDSFEAKDIHNITVDLSTDQAASMLNWTNQFITGENLRGYFQTGVEYKKFDIIRYTGSAEAGFNTGEKLYDSFYYSTIDHISPDSLPVNDIGYIAAYSKDLFINPTYAVELPKETSVVKTEMPYSFTKRTDFGLHANALKEFRIDFKGVSDREARYLLHFLINKQGYRKFTYSIPKIYNQSKVFFAPQWSHTFVYKDVNDISITLVEDPLGLIKERNGSGGLFFTNPISNFFATTTVSHPKPKYLPGQWKSISLGSYGSYDILIDKDDFLYIRGSFTSNTKIDTLEGPLSSFELFPKKISNKKWKDVIALRQTFGVNGSHILGIDTDGYLFSCGQGLYGILGDGTIGVPRSSFQKIGTKKWKKFGLSERIANDILVFAIDENNKLFFWGYGGTYLHGFGDTANRLVPTQVDNDDWLEICYNSSYAMGIKSDKKIYTIGIDNSYGIMARGTMSGSTSYFRTWEKIDDNSNWKSVSFSGSQFATAIKEDGSLYSWGVYAGPNGNQTYINSPVLVSSDIWIDQVSSSTRKYLKNNGDIYYQSYNIAPTLLSNFKYKKIFKNITYGIGHGLNDKDEILRIDSAQFDLNYVTKPQRLYDKKYKFLDQGCFIDKEGKLFVYGRNSYGQWGNSEIVNIYEVAPLAASPIQVGNEKWKFCFSNANSLAAIREDGLLFTWGYNSEGQLGTGNTNWASSPVQIGSKKWKTANVGTNYMSAIDENGYLFCWGLNNFGQLGAGDTIWRSSPVQIGTDKWKALAGSPNSSSSGAIREDGILFTWGWNYDSRTNVPGGQLGTGDSNLRSSPVQIGTDKWKDVSFAGYSMFALREDGTLFRCGDAASGYRLAKVSSPVQLGTKKWKTMSRDGSSFIDFENNFFIKNNYPFNFTNGVQPYTAAFNYMEKGYKSRIINDVIFVPVLVGATTTSYIAFIDKDAKAYACYGSNYISI